MIHLTVVLGQSRVRTKIKKENNLNAKEPTHLHYYDDPRISVAIDEMVEELQRAEFKHPVWPKNQLRQTAIVSGEAGEAMQASLHVAEGRGDMGKLREEIIQTGAMCIRWLINNDYHADSNIEVEPVFSIEVPHGYEKLGNVFCMAIEQSAYGKGKERHATGEPFHEQPICGITRRVGMGYPFGQTEKKIEESQRLDNDAAIFELIGAINYLAAAVIVKSDAVGKSA